MPRLLYKFLGAERWCALGTALRAQTSAPAEPLLGLGSLLIALAVAFTPVLSVFWADTQPADSRFRELPTFAFGICAVLSLLIRPRLGLPFIRTPSWKKSLSLTHTAVALGCVPAVMILIASKTLLADRHDTLARAVGSGSGGPQLALWTKLGLVLAIAAWVAVTEELIFRGLLVSVTRRLRYFRSQLGRDIAAGALSALIFGLAHWPTWGPLPALALVGLGLGFVAGYIANGEQLMPLILYHFAFDALSIAVSVGW